MVNLDRVLAGLNQEQRLAVNTIAGPVLIVAGAGSGKTGVISARIARMLQEGIPQSSILALTFTNKAASEMEERVKEITGLKLSKLTVSTFHAFGVRILREQSQLIGLRPNFTIYDSSDKLSAIREAARELKFDFEPSEVSNFAALFSDIKTRRGKWNEENIAQKPLYAEYSQLMRLYNAVDFDDLIVKPLRLFEDHEETLERYRQRYRYIMVDEFQDTSTIQYLLIRHIGEEHRNLCCVGDDDQSIYSWRGADFTNILKFEADFPEFKEIKLERNYRSTGTILNAANAVIAHNKDRKSKTLWTISQDDEMTLQYSEPDNDRDEGCYIAETMIALRVEEGIPYEKMAVLARTNSLTRSIEDALLSYNIPYAVSGGMSFFSRPEIKDIIAYLRVIDNLDDDVSFLRIINTPRRGMGKSSLERLVEKAREKEYGLYSAACDLVFDGGNAVNSRLRGAMADFVDLFERYREIFSLVQENKSPLSVPLKELIEEIGYWGYLLQEFRQNNKIAKWRYDNIQYFINFLERWEKHPDNLDPTLTQWLNRITLNARDKLDDGDDGKVNLMTIHASKGLEFDVVFLSGLEEGLIPHVKSLLEEERRLFYVAITRARRKLYLSSCRTRTVRNVTVDCTPSQFLREIPEELMDAVDSREDETLSPEEASKYFANMPWK